jgi:hypothetical protein
MNPVARATATIAIVVAFAGIPLAADWCAASCAAARSATQPTSPTCHHVVSATARISHAPAPCGHDHQALIAVGAVNRSTATQIAVGSLPPAEDLHASTNRLLATASRAGPRPGASGASIPLALSSTLRI